MKIGILTHFKANNFGANLQALSTASYLKSRGFIPFFINWGDYLSVSNSRTPNKQVEIHSNFISRFFQCSKECYSDNDIMSVILEEKIRNVIIGSDAVLTVKPYIQYFQINRKGIRFSVPQKDYIFPNPFWLSFYNKKLENVKFFLMSASTQNSVYKFYSKKQIVGMAEQLSLFSYISVRDNWTKKMMQYLKPSIDKFPITPDPVFSFNPNTNIHKDRKSILSKFGLPDNYIVFSFYPKAEPSESWFLKIKEVALSRKLTCVGLPMPQGANFNFFDRNVQLPLDPIDWYHIIKYSSGYIGNNMHPIIVCLHNSVPFFSIDNHGLRIAKCFLLNQSSKTFDLLKMADFIDNWVPASKINTIEIEQIIEKIVFFDKNKSSAFASKKHDEYIEMMTDIINLFVQG